MRVTCRRRCREIGAGSLDKSPSAKFRVNSCRTTLSSCGHSLRKLVTLSWKMGVDKPRRATCVSLGNPVSGRARTSSKARSRRFAACARESGSGPSLASQSYFSVQNSEKEDRVVEENCSTRSRRFLQPFPISYR